MSSEKPQRGWAGMLHVLVQETRTVFTIFVIIIAGLVLAFIVLAYGARGAISAGWYFTMMLIVLVAIGACGGIVVYLLLRKPDALGGPPIPRSENVQYTNPSVDA